MGDTLTWKKWVERNETRRSDARATTSFFNLNQYLFPEGKGVLGQAHGPGLSLHREFSGPLHDDSGVEHRGVFGTHEHRVQVQFPNLGVVKNKLRHLLQKADDTLFIDRR